MKNNQLGGVNGIRTHTILLLQDIISTLFRLCITPYGLRF